VPKLCRSLRSTRILQSNTYLSFLGKLVHRSVPRVAGGRAWTSEASGGMNRVTGGTDFSK